MRYDGVNFRPTLLEFVSAELSLSLIPVNVVESTSGIVSDVHV